MPQPSTNIARILIVTRQDALAVAANSIGEKNSWQVESVASAWTAIERLEEAAAPDLLLLDASRGDTDGLHFLRWLRRLRPQLPAILICDAEESPKYQEATRLGARDILLGPVDERAIETIISRNLLATGETPADVTSEDVERLDAEFSFVGASSVMRSLRAQARLLAATDVPVLIVGEAASGKRSTARLIHELSVRSGSPFAVVNCAALPCDALEIELFGGGKNASVSPKIGKLEHCAKGTLLLQEISEMPLSLQAKLLSILQHKQFERSGTSAPVHLDVRILASSTTNSEPVIAEKRLRVDLYYRLSAYTVHVPPLRERREDIPLLLHFFMRHLSKHYSLSPKTFLPAELEACQAHSWPGNLRDLETFVKRYLMADSHHGLLESQALAGGAGRVHAVAEPTEANFQGATNRWSNGSQAPESLKSRVHTLRLEAEKKAIIEALKTTRGNRKAAARLLGIGYRTLLYKIEQYQLRFADLKIYSIEDGRTDKNGLRENK